MANTTPLTSEAQKIQQETSYFSEEAKIGIAIALTAIFAVGLAIGQVKYNLLTKGIALAIANPAITITISLVVVGAVLYAIIQSLSSREEDIEKGNRSLSDTNTNTTNNAFEKDESETDSSNGGSLAATSPTTSPATSAATTPAASPTLTSKSLSDTTTTTTTSISADEVEDKEASDVQGTYEKLQKEFPILKHHMNEDYWKACLKGQEDFLGKLDFSGLPPLDEKETRTALEKFNKWPVSNNVGVSILDVPAGISEIMIEEILRKIGDGFVVTRFSDIFTKGKKPHINLTYDYLYGEDTKLTEKAYRVVISNDILPLTSHVTIQNMLAEKQPKKILDNIDQIQQEAKKMGINDSKKLIHFVNEKKRLESAGLELPNFLTMLILIALSKADRNLEKSFYINQTVPCNEVVNTCNEVVNNGIPVLVGAGQDGANGIHLPGIYIGCSKASLVNPNTKEAGNTGLAAQVTIAKASE